MMTFIVDVPSILWFLYKRRITYTYITSMIVTIIDIAYPPLDVLHN